MKLQEFMNDDTCQILFAIIIGIVVCYFIFGSGASGSCNRDGFSVGGPCEPTDIQNMQDTCCGDDSDCDPSEVLTCTQACADVYLPMHSDCLIEFADQFGARFEFETLNRNCEATNLNTLNTMCDGLGSTLYAACAQGDGSPCTPDCRDQLSGWRQNCQQYETASQIEFVERMERNCREVEYNANVAGHETEDNTAFEQHKKDILMNFQHIITNERYLAYLNGESTPILGDTGATADDIANSIGLLFMTLKNDESSRQIYPKLLDLGITLTDLTNKNNNYPQVTLGDHFTPFGQMRGKDGSNNSQQKLIATSNLGQKRALQINIQGVSKPEPLLMGLRYMDDADVYHQYYGVPPSASATSEVYDIFNSLSLGPVSFAEYDWTNLVNTFTSRMGSTSITQMRSLLQRFEHMDSSTQLLPRKLFYVGKDSSNESIHESGVNQLFMTLNVDDEDDHQIQEFFSVGQAIDRKLTLLFGAGLSMLGNNIYIKQISTDGRNTKTDLNSVANSGLENVFHVQYNFLKMFLNPGEFYPNNENPFSSYNQLELSNVGAACPLSNPACILGQNIPCKASNDDGIMFAMANQNDLYVTPAEVLTAGYSYAGGYLTKGSTVAPVVSENRFVILPGTDFSKDHFVIAVMTPEAETLLSGTGTGGPATGGPVTPGGPPVTPGGPTVTPTPPPVVTPTGQTTYTCGASHMVNPNICNQYNKVYDTSTEDNRVSNLEDCCKVPCLSNDHVIPELDAIGVQDGGRHLNTCGDFNVLVTEVDNMLGNTGGESFLLDTYTETSNCCSYQQGH